MKDLTKIIRCPLRNEDGKCKSPYLEGTNQCPDDFLKCTDYLVYMERERFRRVQLENAKYFKPKE
jgi:hypothetical protein